MPEDGSSRRPGRPPRRLDPGASSAARLGAEIRSRRELRGLTLREFAGLVGFSVQHISAAERSETAVSAEFVEACDRVLETGGALVALFPLVVQERAAERHRNRARRRRAPRAVGWESVGATEVRLVEESGTARAMSRPEGFDRFTGVLLRHRPVGADVPEHASVDLSTLNVAVASARRSYQACRYVVAVKQLAAVLGALRIAETIAEGEHAHRVAALSAEAHHVAAGVLLKLGHEGLAYIAADRSMGAAERSEDPLAIGSSGRIVVHAFMSAGHCPEGTATTKTLANRLDAMVRKPSADYLSVYGSLLLRGAIAAARDGDRAGALDFLDEAEAAARRFGADSNRRWSAFGPANVVLHRVNVAVTFGDAGAAIDFARTIDVGRLAVTERKAALHLDVARAYMQWPKYAEACDALYAAERLAPEEVRSRPLVRALVADMAQRAPRTALPGIRALAGRIEP